MPIGVFDSGLGGLTVLQALQKTMPDQSFIYFGDNANAPIGSKTEREITDLTMAATGRLFSLGCDLVILACNTASAVALRAMQEFWVPADRRVLGVFVPVIEVLAGRSWADRSPPLNGPSRSVALFATPATVASGAFERELGLRIKGTHVVSQPCPGLVAALEAGEHDRAENLVKAFVGDVLSRDPNVAAAVLGCTHYPLLQNVFARHLPVGTEILSQPDLVAESLRDYLIRHPRFRQKGSTQYLTSGDATRVAAEARYLTGAAIGFTTI